MGRSQGNRGLGTSLADCAFPTCFPKRISQAMAGFQRESETVLHVDKYCNSAESSDEPKPKRQRSAGKTKKYDVLTIQLYSSANS